MASAQAQPPHLLLLSNSRNPAGEYLVHARNALGEFARERRKALFYPFASVTTSWDDFVDLVQDAVAPLGWTLTGAHRCADLARATAEAELILVGGGNTFRLLREMRQRGALDAVRRAVAAGAHYVGWSAGAVVATPSIGTTNDMPIIDPLGLDALALVPFQINAHYHNALPAGHQGETRNQRLAEYLALNPKHHVLALPEGNWLEVRGAQYRLHGPHDAMLFGSGTEPLRLPSGPWTPP